MPFMTICTCPKPFDDAHITVIQRNAIASWKKIGENIGLDVEVMLVGRENGVEEIAQEYGAIFVPDVDRNSKGTPLVSSIFQKTREYCHSPLIAYVNADVILLPDFLLTAQLAANQSDHFLAVGQRWDLNLPLPLDYSNGWDTRLLELCHSAGKRHPRGGSDYFIFRRDDFRDIPPLVVGRAGWDNWMIYFARNMGWPAIDCSLSINIIHQDHDYSHLPGGRPHYRLPESYENVRIGGGPLRIFTLDDTNYVIKDGKLAKSPFSWSRFWREIEIMPLVRWKSERWSNFFFSVFHPLKAYRNFRRDITHKNKPTGD